MYKKAHRIAAWMAVTIGLATLTGGADAGTRDDSPDVIVEWNQLLQANMPATTPNPLVPRLYAMMHIAMFDAANAIRRQYTPYHARFYAHPEASAEAAAAQA